MGSLIDTKGNKIAGFDSIDKKQARVNVCFHLSFSMIFEAWEIHANRYSLYSTCVYTQYHKSVVLLL